MHTSQRQGQGAAGGMVSMFSTPLPQLTEAEALARLPAGSTIHEAGNGFIAVALAVQGRVANAFADYCYPFYIHTERLGTPRFGMRRENLAAFVARWEAWA